MTVFAQNERPNLAWPLTACYRHPAGHFLLSEQSNLPANAEDSQKNK
jgi:hypothetical protein